MRRILLFSLIILNLFFKSSAQTTLINPNGDGGFENGADFASNGWTVVNHTTNTWQVGSVPTSYSGTKCGFVSNNGGTSWLYTITSSETSIL